MCTHRRLLRLSALLALIFSSLTLRVYSTKEIRKDEKDVAPHVFISVLITNSLHLMPNFFGYLEGLDYPKDRISIWIRTDHNVDGTPAVLSMWCRAAKYGSKYKSVDCSVSRKWVYPTTNPYSKPVQRYKNIARLRQQALEAARIAEADYMLTLDADCFLVNSRILQLLIEQNKTIVAPMLDAGYNSAYSNFWMAQDDLGNYARGDIYMPIIERKRVGCFSAPVVFGTVLVHLSSPYSENLMYHPPHHKFMGPVNDVLQFAFSARIEGTAMHILNTEFFGYIMKEEKYKDINEASRKFFQFKLNTLVNDPPVLYSNLIPRQVPIIKNFELRLDAVYVINLARRPERRARMAAILDELGYNYTIIDAVDGRDLNKSYVEDELGIRYMANRRDTHDNRTMLMGEVGAFLSHYSIWKKMVSENQKAVLVLEDDVQFKSSFTSRLYNVLREARRVVPTWDHIYLGWNRIDYMAKEERIKGTRWLVRPAYSYSMYGYLLTGRGAKKLLDADPFHSLLPADEFIAIMYGAHPRKDWCENFPVRDLNVYSAHPTLITPQHYEGQDGWFSDTAPIETITDIREKKKEEEMSKVDDSHREDVKKRAIQRQIEAVRMKIKTKDEL